MKLDFTKLSKLRLYQFIRSENKNIIPFLVCLLIAASLWFLNALNKEYTINMSYPIKYINLPQDKMIKNTPPNHFNLKVKAGGFSILSHKLSLSFTPLVLDCQSFFPNSNDSNAHLLLRIPTRKLEDRIANQVSSDLKILSIAPDSLIFELEQLTQKRIRVEANISYELTKQHFISDRIKFSPDSITVYGPRSVIDTLQAVHTEQQHYAKLGQSIRRNITIQGQNNLQYSPKRVVMEVPVAEYTEKVIEVPIEIINAPEEHQIKLFPDKTKVSFLVSLSDFSSISAKDFKLIVDYKKSVDNSDILNIELLHSPSYTYAIQVETTQVEYLILNTQKHD